MFKIKPQHEIIEHPQHKRKETGKMGCEQSVPVHHGHGHGAHKMTPSQKREAIRRSNKGRVHEHRTSPASRNTRAYRNHHHAYYDNPGYDAHCYDTGPSYSAYGGGWGGHGGGDCGGGGGGGDCGGGGGGCD